MHPSGIKPGQQGGAAGCQLYARLSGSAVVRRGLVPGCRSALVAPQQAALVLCRARPALVSRRTLRASAYRPPRSMQTPFEYAWFP